MKKIAFIFVFMVFAAINVSADGGLGMALKSCERYGTEVLVTFALENRTGKDMVFRSEKNDILVLDAEGNKYLTSGFTSGALCDGKPDNDDSFVFGVPEVYAPIGSKGHNFDGVEVPDDVDVLIRFVVYDVPATLRKFDCIQIRNKEQDSDDNFNENVHAYSTSWSQAEFPKMAIVDVK